MYFTVTSTKSIVFIPQYNNQFLNLRKALEQSMTTSTIFKKYRKCEFPLYVMFHMQRRLSSCVLYGSRTTLKGYDWKSSWIMSELILKILNLFNTFIVGYETIYSKKHIFWYIVCKLISMLTKYKYSDHIFL